MDSDITEANNPPLITSFPSNFNYNLMKEIFSFLPLAELLQMLIINKWFKTQALKTELVKILFSFTKNNNDNRYLNKYLEKNAAMLLTFLSSLPAIVKKNQHTFVNIILLLFLKKEIKHNHLNNQFILKLPKEVGSKGFAFISHLLPKCTQVTVLDCTNANLGIDNGVDKLLTSLNLMKTLTNVNLCQNNLNGESLNRLLKGLTNDSIRSIDLSCNHFSIDDYGYLKEYLLNNNKNITQLNVSENKVKVKDNLIQMMILPLVDNNTSVITHLVMGGNDISNQGCLSLVDFIMKNKTLKVLDLGRNKISNKGVGLIISALDKNSDMKLKELSLQSNLIDKDGVITISKYLQENDSIEVLNLSNNNLGKTGAFILADGINFNVSLTHLYLKACQLGDSGIQCLMKSLIDSNTLDCLDISNNDLTNDCTEEISRLLTRNTSLSSLNISFGDITQVENIAQALKHNTSLTYINLSNNDISDEEMTHFFSIIESNTKRIHPYSFDISNNGLSASILLILSKLLQRNLISKLSLSGNKVNKENLKIFSKAISDSTSLIKLNLSQMNICNECLQILTEGIAQSQSLQYVDLSKNKFNGDPFNKLQEQIRKNKGRMLNIYK